MKKKQRRKTKRGMKKLSLKRGACYGKKDKRSNDVLETGPL